MPAQQLIQSAIALTKAGHLRQAEAACRQILQKDPRHADALHLLGLIALQTGNHATAVESISQAITVNRVNPAFHCNLGLAYQALNRIDKAIDCYQSALQISPGFAEAHYYLGTAYSKQNHPDDAMACLQRAVQLRPGYADAYRHMGYVFVGTGRLDEAGITIKKASDLNPGDAQAHYDLGTIFLKQGRLNEAVASLHKAIALRPDFVEAHINLGTVLLNQGKPDEAIGCYQQAIALNPGYADAYINLGTAYQSLNRTEEALTSYEQALSLRPDHADTHWNEALCRLLLGDFKRGWSQHEWRWKRWGGDAQRPFSQPQWRGEDITGKTILLHAEQGLGDTLQFCRYAPAVAARGAKIVLEVQPALKSLLSRLAGPAQVLARGEVLPDFDIHCPLLSLPLACGTTLDEIPADVPYLSVNRDKAQAWQARLGAINTLRVGLAWSGFTGHRNDRNRSLPLSALMRLNLAGVTLVSLQKEIRESDRQLLSAHPEIKHYGERIDDFDDTAALIDCVDLVISVDTSVAHLAGALGKPVWILLPFAPDYRWLLDRTDSPWYPTARLFRQPAIGDWNSVIQHIAAELNKGIIR